MPHRTASGQRELEIMGDHIRNCVLCPLHESRTIAVPGEGTMSAQFMIIGEAPGRDEDRTGRPFIGSAGRYLDQVLSGTGIERSDFFITNTVKCRPPNNRTPKTGEIDICTRHYLFRQIELVDPKLILLLGSVAVKTMLGLKRVEDARGKILQSQGRKFMATYHPASRFYREDLAEKIEADFTLFKTELERLAAPAASR